mmetsp:Transcript_24252/g.51439  ORF Transcript_24252/g.51439 Transcript_24252/m.51439 type:complete len:483 (+) Transcript_24252:104-1552(+)
MFLRLSHVYSILSLLASLGATTANSDGNLDHLDKNARFVDFIGGLLGLGDISAVECIAKDITKTFTECCPANDSSDGICNLLRCFGFELEGFPTITNSCNCRDLEGACEQIGNFKHALTLAGFGDVCSEVDECCDGPPVPTHDEFNMCILDSIRDGDIKLPDFLMSLLPKETAATARPTKAPTKPIVQCILNDITNTFTECCPPSPSDSSVGICKLLRHCFSLDLDGVPTLKYGCDCGDVEDACDQMGPYNAMLALAGFDICSGMYDCCDDGTTTNNQFNACMIKSMKDGDIALPPFLVSLLPTVEEETSASAEHTNPSLFGTHSVDGTKFSTASLSNKPTHDPTTEPTNEPTTKPTSRPMREPSNPPSKLPSANPTTMGPTDIPTRETSKKPSESPSITGSFINPSNLPAGNINGFATTEALPNDIDASSTVLAVPSAATESADPNANDGKALDNIANTAKKSSHKALACLIVCLAVAFMF